MSNIKSAILIRIQIAFLAVLLVAVAIFVKVLYIQIFEGENWREAERNIDFKVTPALRGNIYADDGVTLATSIPLFRVAIDPMIMSSELHRTKLDSLCLLLSKKFKDKSKKEYKKMISEGRRNGKRFLILNKKLVTYSQKKAMESWPIFRKGGNVGGVIFEKIQKRTYPFGQLANRTVGRDDDNKNGVGLELSFEKLLAGKNGEALYRRLAGGDWKPINDGSRIKPQKGYNIYTTLNVDIQDICHKILEKSLEKYKADYGCVVVMDVKTGNIKAMVNLGMVQDSSYQEVYNYTIGDQGSTDPGSTFKLASMLALLEENPSIDPVKDMVETHGGRYTYFGRVMRDDGYYGKLSVAECLYKSSNVGVSKLITSEFGKNPNKYINYLYDFGLGKQLDFEIEGMAKPYIKRPSDPTWSGTTLPWMSVGYETNITPLQVLMLYNAVANGGKLIQPNIVKEIRDADKVIKKFEPKILNPKICSPATIAKIKPMLEDVVKKGTAKRIYTKEYKIAGKTGTARKLVNGVYRRIYKTSFAGYFPADNPKYSCIVIVDRPRVGRASGGSIAAPVFREIADKLYVRDLDMQQLARPNLNRDFFQVNIKKTNVTHKEDVLALKDKLQILSILDMQGEQTADLNQSESDWLVPYSGKKSVRWKERNVKDGLMPNLKGMTLRDAVFILENLGYTVYYSGQGKVKTQSIMPGTPIKKGEKVRLFLSPK